MNAQRSRGGTNASATDTAQRLEVPSIGGQNGMSRAEKFEDEKRRIIESCFAKKDPDGKYAESYITHICITEDGSSPSVPPPPTSPQENKKPRIIIVAVKRTGRVRMHKGRENSNSTFSIGKSWVLDDLSAIESFANSTPTTYDEQQRKDWAGDAGFLVTIQKPYYWQAISSKEKDFFIGSLIKIYKKYTGGKLPQLTGFSTQELTEMTGQAQRPRTPQSPSSRTKPLPPSSTRPAPGSPAALLKDPSRDASRELKYQSSNDSGLRGFDGSDREISIPGQFPSSESLLAPRLQETPRSQPLNFDSPSAQDRMRNPSMDSPLARDDRNPRPTGRAPSIESFQSRQEERSRNPSMSAMSTDRLRTNGTNSPFTRTETPPVPGPRSPERKLSNSMKSPDPPASRFGQQEQIPERRRPPLLSENAGRGSPFAPSAPSPSDYMTPTDGPSPRDPPDRIRRNALDDLIMSEQKSPSDYFMNGSKPSPQFMESNREGSPQQSIKSIQLASQGTQDSATSSNLVMSPTTSEDSSRPETPQEIHRPGLGPMIKKKSTKEIANAFRKAAVAHNAFKPRAGGAAEKLKSEALQSPNTPDGINGVFPAPSFQRETPKNPLPPNTSNNLTLPPLPPPAALDPPPGIPDVKITPSATPEMPTSEFLGNEVVHESNPSPERKMSNILSPEERRRKRPSNNSAKYAKALGIDPILLEGRTSDIESALTDFGWGEGDAHKKSITDLQSDIRRDLARLETGSWLGADDHNDERVAAVGTLLDKAIAECDELDGLLTLYNVELGTLSEDVAYIEAQSQGLQVQTANQRLLHTELQNLLDTITISASQLRILKEASLTKPQGVGAVEVALSQLYKAMLTIDPKIRQSGGRPIPSDGLVKVDGGNNIEKVSNEISSMRAVQEKRDGYRRESLEFVQRFKQYMSVKFREAEANTMDAIERTRSGSLPMKNSKMDTSCRNQARGGLWIYSPLMLFARDIDFAEWEELLRMYENTAKKPYQEELRDNITAWKRVARTPSGDEQDVLFTTQEKESDGLVARTLTVKRSKAFRDGPRTPSAEKAQDGKIPGYEAFAGALFDICKAIFMEQNFVVDLFHVSSLETTEFPDVVAASAPEDRHGGMLEERRLFDPDRTMAKRVQNTMDDMFSFWPTDLQNFVDWVVKQDALQGIGVLFALESKLAELEETNQEFMTQVLTKIQSRLGTRFDRFVEEQIRGIEETKVKIKKRKGVIAFVKTFPYFCSAVENMFPVINSDAFEVRHMVNDVYIKINKAMFESLKFIAKESPVIMAGQKAQGQTGGDAEDKEILNYHILLIENMNHYVEEVEARNNPILREWRDRAMKEMAEHMDLYLSAVVRRPLGKLLDFLESTESLIANAPNGPPSIATRASHSRAVFKKVLSTFDAREIRRGIETLKKRVEKHFGDADDPSLSRNLVQKVQRACEERYLNVYERANRIVADVYGGDLEVDFKREDVSSAFRR